MRDARLRRPFFFLLLWSRSFTLLTCWLRSTFSAFGFNESVCWSAVRSNQTTTRPTVRRIDHYRPVLPEWFWLDVDAWESWLNWFTFPCRLIELVNKRLGPAMLFSGRIIVGTADDWTRPLADCCWERFFSLRCLFDCDDDDDSPAKRCSHDIEVKCHVGRFCATVDYQSLSRLFIRHRAAARSVSVIIRWQGGSS